jgi:hypothetical protein
LALLLIFPEPNTQQELPAAQSSTGPAGQQDAMSKDKMDKDAMKKDGMKKDNMQTTVRSNGTLPPLEGLPGGSLSSRDFPKLFPACAIFARRFFFCRLRRKTAGWAARSSSLRAILSVDA